MLNRTQNILILIVMMTGAMLFMAVLNRIWPREKRREHNDLIGWQLGILGTTYAVILGFMLYTVWTTFGAAELNADLETSTAWPKASLHSNACYSNNKPAPMPTPSSTTIGQIWPVASSPTKAIASIKPCGRR